MILVDVDNLYIVEQKVNPTLLKKRMMYLIDLKRPIMWFGNAFTAKVLQGVKELSHINMTITNKDKDTADHAILAYLSASPHKIAHIVSNDKALAAAAWYLCPYTKIRMMTYAKPTTITPAISDVITKVEFKRQSDVQKLMLSLQRFTERYRNISAIKQRGV